MKKIPASAAFFWLAAHACSAWAVAGFDLGQSLDAKAILMEARESRGPGVPLAASPAGRSARPTAVLVQPDGGASQPPIELTVLDGGSAAALFSEIANDEDIPFDFPEGCHAKAEKIVLLLERKGVIAGKAFVEGQLYQQSHWGKSYWLFHVAPVILVDSGGEVRPFIIDPFLSNELVPYEKWVALLNKDEMTKIARRYFTNRFVYDPSLRASNPDRYDPALLSDMEIVLEQLRVRLANARKP